MAKSKELGSKLRRRETELKAAADIAAEASRTKAKLEADALHAAAQQSDARRFKKDFTRCQQALTEQVEKHHTLVEELETLKRELAHAHRVQDGVHWDPGDAARSARKDEQIEELSNERATLMDEKRKLELSLSRSALDLTHYRERERTLAKLNARDKGLKASLEHERLLGRDEGRKEAMLRMQQARADLAKSEAARVKALKAVERGRLETENARTEAERVARAYPQAASMDAAASAARADASRAEAAAQAAEAQNEALRAKHEELEAAWMREAAKAGAEAARAEAARQAASKAETARAALATALAAAEEVAARANGTRIASPTAATPVMGQSTQGQATTPGSDSSAELYARVREAESRVEFLEGLLICKCEHGRLSTWIAPPATASTTPCKVCFEFHGPRALGGSKLWMGFVSPDGRASSFYQLISERQDINSFVGAGILLIRAPGTADVQNSQCWSAAQTLSADHVICSFQPLTPICHTVKVLLRDDGSVEVKAGPRDTSEGSWQLARKLPARVQQAHGADSQAIQEFAPVRAPPLQRAKENDLAAEAMARLRGRLQNLPTSMDKLRWWKELNWAARKLNDGDCIDVSTLARKGAFDNVDSFRLDRNRIGSAGVVALTNACACGCFVKVERLDLSDNQISEEGAAAFAKACADGALARLHTLHLYGNPIGDVGMASIAKALELGAPGGPLLSSVLVLGLHLCGIGDEGVGAFADAIKKGGVLAACRELYLHGNRIDTGGMRALEQAILKWGALRSCRKLTVYANPASGTQVLNALQSQS